MGMNGCKVQIGSKYIGPALDRSPLRTMPRGWTLEETKPVRERWWQKPGTWIAVAVVCSYFLCIAQTVAQWTAK